MDRTPQALHLSFPKSQHSELVPLLQLLDLGSLCLILLTHSGGPELYLASGFGPLLEVESVHQVQGSDSVLETGRRRQHLRSDAEHTFRELQDATVLHDMARFTPLCSKLIVVPQICVISRFGGKVIPSVLKSVVFAQAATLELCSFVFICSDITNTLVGISGETAPVARISCFVECTVLPPGEWWF